MAYLVQHKNKAFGSYLTEHDVWPTYIVKDKALATRYPTREKAEARRLAIGEDFAPFFEVIADD